MQLRRRCCALTLGFAVPLAMSSVVRADAVTDWNAIAMQAIAGSPSHPGATAILDSAMVQVAVYDAVEAINCRFRPYHVRIQGATGSPAAAVAKATHDVLVNRFPSLTGSLDTTYHDYLAAHGLSESDSGVAVGQQAAAGIIALRANDGSFPVNPPPFIGGTKPGVWHPTPSYLPGPPSSNSPALAPWLATVTPFTLVSPSQFRAVPPPPLTSKRYATAYKEVKSLGSATNSSRTPAQTDLALFWFSNYQVLWNRVLRDIAGAHVHNIDDSARLFALVIIASTNNRNQFYKRTRRSQGNSSRAVPSFTSCEASPAALSKKAPWPIFQQHPKNESLRQSAAG